MQLQSLKLFRSNGLGEDTFTRNVTYAGMHRQMDDGPTWYEINISFFSKEKSGYKNDG